MKKIIFLLLAVFLPACFGASAVFAEDISGQWHGLLKEHGVHLKITLNVTRSDERYFATLYSPERQAEGMPVTSIIFEEPVLRFRIIDLAVEYRGTLDENGKINGVFTQNGLSFDLIFSREEIKRAQEPKRPYPYKEENVEFRNKEAGVLLAATLTVPKGAGPFPAVILISGSGPQNRDGEIFGHKPFLVIADYLTRNGIAVLRYDDRGTASSSGDFKSATTADFAADAKAAFEFLKTVKNIDGAKVGLIGHGEGAASASITASAAKDVKFIVLLSGAGVSGKEIILKRNEVMGKAAKVKRKELKRDLKINKRAIEIASGPGNIGQIRSALTEYISKTYDGFDHAQMPRGIGKVDFMRMYLNAYANTWMRFFLTYDPSEALEKVKCPALALWGSKDLEVSPKENMKAVKKALKEAGNKNFTEKIYPGLNHLFQNSKTGLPEEYRQIEQTFSQEVLEDMLKWIQTQSGE